MRLASVRDIDVKQALMGLDAALLAVGSEPRSMHVARLLLEHGVERALIHGMTFEGADDQDIRRHRTEFSEAIGRELRRSSPDDDAIVFRTLELATRTATPHGSLHLLIDYSSMPRGWYSAVLNWIRSRQGLAEVILDFMYSVGRYGEEWTPKTVVDVCAIPGCDGGPSLDDKKIAVFGLGFDGLAPFSVLERIEPDEVLAYVTDPGATDDAPIRSHRVNAEFIEDEVDELFHLPLRSVEATYRVLGETISVNRRDASIVLVPLGAKPHILASVLAAYRYPGTACLRVLHHRRFPHRVESSGEVVVTRVVFESETAVGACPDAASC